MGRLAPDSGPNPEPYTFLGTQPISALICNRVPPNDRAEWFDLLRWIIQRPTVKR